MRVAVNQPGKFSRSEQSRSNVSPKYADPRRFFARLVSEILLTSLQTAFFNNLLETGIDNPQFFQQEPDKNKSHLYVSALSGAAGAAGSEPVPLRVKLTVLQMPPTEKHSQPHFSHRSRAKANHSAHTSIRTR